MATNVTEKDKTLQEIIDWCEKHAIEGLRRADDLLKQDDMDAYGVVEGQIHVYRQTADHCRQLLGYSGSMPDEVPDQSEGAGISNREELTELVARKLWLEWNCELEGIDKTADDWAKLDSGTVFDKAEADGWRNVAWQILEGIRRYKVRKYNK